MKCRIIPGTFGYYLNKGSWDESNPDSSSIEIELHSRPCKDEAVIFEVNDIAHIGNIQEIVTSSSFTYLFVPNVHPL